MSTPEVEVPPAPAGCESAEILLIDDDSTVRRVLEKTLCRAGYSVQCPPDGKTALGLLARHSFRLVITDIYMPDVDGYEVIMKIHAMKPRPQILAISGGIHGSADNSLKTAQLLGSSRLMAKPFELAQFCATIRDLIGPPVSAGTA